MPVSTRSQVTVNQIQNESSQDQEGFHMSHHMRNPHHGLKEKLKALTLLYEQQKQASVSHNNPSYVEPRFATNDKRDGEDLRDTKPISHVMRENLLIPSSNVTKNFVIPQPSNLEEAKENVAKAAGGERIMGFSCQRKANHSSNVVRKLPMGGNVGPYTEPRGKQKEDLQEIDIVSTKAPAPQGNCKVGSKILVFVRLRPMSKKEKEAGSRCCVRIANKRDVYLTEFANENDYLRLKRLKGRHFTFDASFPDSTTQLEVYSTTTAELVEAVLQGKNGSVFCYGATGAGKTYTMLGTVENPGVMVLAIKDLFSKIRQRSFEGNHVVHLSYLEVYNETVRDLLSPGRPLVLREDKQGIVASGLTQYQAYTTDEVMTLLQQGNKNRTTEPTRANETSSRSHAILQVIIEYKVKDASDNILNRIGKLSLIDLAGSERALATDQRTLRSLEGANINRSLLALSSCINALVEGKKHIPYRNSKLTQLLKDSLGGPCNTVMIANISPSNLSFGETQNTLHWADRAKEIRTKACDANEEIQVPDSEADKAKLLLELQKENRELRMQLARVQQKLLTVQAQTLAANCPPTPSTTSSLLSTAPSSVHPNDKGKARSNFFAPNCFTPESKRKGTEEALCKLQKTVKALEAEMDKLKKDHSMQIKQKDDFIRELSRKGTKSPGMRMEGGDVRRVVTRSSIQRKEQPQGELKSPSHRFLSPAPTAKKRSFWDISTANSPSVTMLNGRKTRSHVNTEPVAAAPSMLIQLAYPCFWFMFMLGPHVLNYTMQPGFARQRPEAMK